MPGNAKQRGHKENAHSGIEEEISIFAVNHVVYQHLNVYTSPQTENIEVKR